MKNRTVFVLFNVIFLIEILRSSSASSDQDAQAVIELPPCKACTVLVDSIHSFKENIPNGLDDEAALKLLMGNACSDVTRGQKQCSALLEVHAAEVKQYWRQGLFENLCIDKLKVCCPPDHFGPKCEKCQECYKNGKCKGAGTRKGNGKCSCHPGYQGDHCRECAVSYYPAFKDESKLLCSKCHNACGTEGCSTAGPKGCTTCKPGWRMDESTGCNDVNECLETRNICTAAQFCVNNDGSYSCLECDRSCNGCDGDGPDMCKTCAEGYTLIEGKCTDDSVEQREQYINMTRFFTYLGLCFATFVIFQSSTTKAYMVGAAVATYIAASEYWLSTTPAPADIKSQLNSKKLEDLIMNLL